MSSSRRAFAAAVAAALAGCTRAGREQKQTGDATRRDPSPQGEGSAGIHVPGARSGSFEDQFDGLSSLPDITVKNHDTDGVTAYLTVRARWHQTPLYRTVVSLRGRTSDERPIQTSIQNVDAPRSRLRVTTADGVRDDHPYHGGSQRLGVTVLLHADRIEFEDRSL